MGALASTLLLTAGGSYSAGTCQPGGDIRTAQQMCAAHGVKEVAGRLPPRVVRCGTHDR